MFEGIHRINEYLKENAKTLSLAFLHGGCVGFPALNAMGFGRHTFNGDEMLEASKLLQPGMIIPLHYDGWAHFRESKESLATKLESLGKKVQWLSKGQVTELAVWQ